MPRVPTRGRRVPKHGPRAGDGTVRLWDTDSGRELLALEVPVLREHTDSICDVTFSRDGQIQYMTGMTKPGRSDFFINQGLEPVAAITGALGPGFVSGSDRLGQGSVEIAFSGITETFEIATSLKHAQPNATYSVLFCHFPSGSSDCSFITQVGTDVHGNSTMTTPLPRGDYYGVFVFTRIAGGQEQAEFVTAFRVR